MTCERKRASGRLAEAAEILPCVRRAALLALPGELQAQVEEIRLRTGQAPTIVLPEGERALPGENPPVTRQELEVVAEVAGRGSTHTALEQLRRGFLTIRGGHRVGICGTVVIRDGEIRSFRVISSLSIRIAREVPGVGRGVLEQLIVDDQLQSTLILSPPGCGKTTLLRDLIRCISQGDGVVSQRIGVADDRGELADMWEGVAQMEVGPCTDVIDGCPKAQALTMLVRGMNPQVVATDEVTSLEDANALLTAAGCGVTLLATAHGDGPESLSLRPAYRQLQACSVFSRLVLIQIKEGHRAYRVLRRDGGEWA